MRSELDALGRTIEQQQLAFNADISVCGWTHGWAVLLIFTWKCVFESDAVIDVLGAAHYSYAASIVISLMGDYVML
jgi:hypothetical protein